MIIHDAAQPRCPARGADDPATTSVRDMTCRVCLAHLAADTGGAG